MKYLFTSIFFIAALAVTAQVTQQLDVHISISGNDISYGFNGGTNNPQFHRVDLNDDGILDLYYFDKIGNVSMTYLYDNSGGMNYDYAPVEEQVYVFIKDSIRTIPSLLNGSISAAIPSTSYTMRPVVVQSIYLCHLPTIPLSRTWMEMGT